MICCSGIGTRALKSQTLLILSLSPGACLCPNPSTVWETPTGFQVIPLLSKTTVSFSKAECSLGHLDQGVTSSSALGIEVTLGKFLN